MPLSIYLSYISKKSILALAVMATILSGLFALTSSQAQTAPQNETLVWSDEFNSTSVDTTKWTVVEQQKDIESHHQGRYQKRNVAVKDGNLHIVTQRHCVTGSELPSETNTSTAPCPAGTLTKYSSGQIRTPYLWKEGKMEIRAKMPKTTQSGLWSGFWLRQQGAWCTKEYGEIDILEWYSDAKSTNASTATTHVSCANDKLKSRQHLERVSGSLADSWHTWGVEWDKTGVKYFLDGKVIGSIASHRPNDSDQNKDTYTDYDGMTQAEFESIMDRPWHLRINTQVYPSDDQWHKAPDNSATFTPQTMLVDYVRVYRTGTTIPVTPEPVTGTDTPATPVTPAPVTPVDQADKEPVTTPTAPVRDEPKTTPPTETPVKSDNVRPVISPTPRTESTISATPQPENHTEAIAPLDSKDENSSEVPSQPAVDPTSPASLPQTGNTDPSVFAFVPPILILVTSYYWFRSQR